MLRVFPAVRSLKGAAAALALQCIACLIPVAAGSSRIDSLTEDLFAEQISGAKSALVAFVTPWCVACRILLSELERLKVLLAQQSANLLVLQCDVSRETRLAQVYQAWRTPLVLFFPDTQLLAPGLQVTFAGQLVQANILAFLNSVGASLPRQLRSNEQLREEVENSGNGGAFVGFFRSPDIAGPLQELWPLECLRRHRRAFTFARWDSNASHTEEAQTLWRWAGLSWGSNGQSKEGRLREVQEGQMIKQELQPSDLQEPEEAIVYVRSDGSSCEFAPKGLYQEGGSSSSTTKAWSSSPSERSNLPWRTQVDAFCAWCERQVLAPVTIFDPLRAAALDGTFEWLLLLFAPREAMEDAGGDREAMEKHFAGERRLLERFTVAACASDRRYKEVLPVIVPSGGEEITAFRTSFGLGPQDPMLPLPGAKNAAAAAAESTCRGLQAAEKDGQRQQHTAFFATVLFNTRTRRKYPAPGGAGWCPGDELALCLFTDAVLDGHIQAHIRTMKRPPEVDVTAPQVKELIGSSVEVELLEPVAAGETEVLLLFYAPFCSHSLHFFPLWSQLAAALAATAKPGGQLPSSDQAPNNTAGGQVLRLAQMNAVQNEHPDLPPVQQYPTLMLCLPDSGASDAANPRKGRPVRYLVYDQPATLNALLSWIAEHSAFAPPLVGVEGLQYSVST